jgi:DnaK suppressor protein
LTCINLPNDVLGHDHSMSTSITHPLDVYKTQLIAARKQLLERIAHERGGLVSRADMAADHFDNSFQSRAQIQTERQTEFALNEHETAELGDLDAALERIEAGTYGVCTDCGITIAAARLKVYPTAKRCIDCQTVAEQRR